MSRGCMILTLTSAQLHSNSPDGNEPVRDHFPPPLLCCCGGAKVGAAPEGEYNRIEQ